MKNHHDHCNHVHSHGDEHAHHGSHGHSGLILTEKPSRAFQISIVFNLLFVVIEFYFGYVSQSLSLIGDALHNLGDVFALALSWLGFYLARSRSTEKLTFGWKKFSILAAFFNAFTLMVTSVFIIFEAYERFIHPTSQNSVTMMMVSGIGFGINLFTALLFHKDHAHDLNIKSAYLHLLGDAIISLSVLIAGSIIYFYKWDLIDPVVSMIISVVILAGTWGLFKESVILLLNGVPQQINYNKVFEMINTSVGVKDVIELRIWALSTSEFALSAKLKGDDKLNQQQLGQKIKRQFGIHSVTIQVN